MAQKLVAVTAQIDLVDLAGLVAHRAVPATHCKGRTVLKS
jgi:hypothetical protein